MGSVATRKILWRGSQASKVLTFRSRACTSILALGFELEWLAKIALAGPSLSEQGELLPSPSTNSSAVGGC